MLSRFPNLAEKSDGSNDFSRARFAVSLTFILNGFAVGTFISRIPDFKHILHLSNTVLGNSLFFASIGVLAAISPAGRNAAKRGSAPVVFASTIALAVAVPFIGLLFNLPFLWLSLFIYGFFQSCQDLSMNAHAVTLEQKSTKRMMSVFHAMWSIGSLCGGAIGGVISQLGIKPIWHTLVVGAIIAAVGIWLRSWFLPPSADIHPIDSKKRTKRPKVFWIYGLLGMCAAIPEGAAADWGGILARDTYHATPFLSTLPFVFFASTMVMGRLSGDLVAHRFGTMRALSYSGLLGACGLTIGLLINNIYGEIFGWIILGFGMSLGIPLTISAAGSTANKNYSGIISSAEAVAMVSGISYFGFVIGPPCMGFLADHLTLHSALFVIVSLALILAIGSRISIKD